MLFLMSWFINAASYAFRGRLKELNEYYSFSINNAAELPVMTFEVKNYQKIYADIFMFLIRLKK